MAIVGAAIVLSIPAEGLAQSTEAGSDSVLSYHVGSSQPAKDDGSTGIVNTGALNIRSGPGLGYEVVAIAYQGTVVTLVGRHSENNWLKVRLNNGTEGWVNSAYIHPGTSTSTLPIVEESLTPGSLPPNPSMTIVATGALNLRSSPILGDNILMVLRRGEGLIPLGRNEQGSWLLVRSTSNEEGWVNASYLHIGLRITDLPLISQATANVTAKIVLGAVNVRKGPGSVFDSFAVLQHGQSASLVGRSPDGQWILIQTDDAVSGWVSISAFQNDVFIHSLPVVDNNEPPNSAMVITGALNVRLGPGTNFGIFTTIFKGDVVTMLGRALYSNWVQVQLTTGSQGWVNSRYLSGHDSIDLLPVAWP